MRMLVDTLVMSLLPFFLIIGILLLPFILIFLLKDKNTMTGRMGEHAVDQKLRELPSDIYKVIDDVMLEINGVTHQIDHIVVSKYGLFVIEAKCYKGMITGKEKDYYWYQYLGKRKYKLINPIHQNYGHIKSISELLNISEKDLISIVCFTNQSELKIDVKSEVIQRKDLANRIIELSKEERNIDVEKIYNQLLELNIVDSEKRKQHVIDTNQKRVESEVKVINMICPKCGGQLVNRKGKYGNFIGCSNYPRCNFTKK